MNSLPVIISLINARYQEEREQEQKQEEQCKKEELAAELLLAKGYYDFMLIGEKETVLMIAAIYDHDYWLWKATANNKVIEEKTFDKCFQKVIQEYEAKGVQVIPFSVYKETAAVDKYWIMIKIDDAKK